MNPSTIELAATIIFALAVIHTFVVSKFAHMAHHYPKGSIGENFFHFMAEVEAVFGIWSVIFIGVVIGVQGLHAPIEYLESLNFTEPGFVFVIMAMAGTRPVIKLAEKIIITISRMIPLPRKMAFYFTTLVMGPLLGSFITEPAAMTVTAIILLKNFYSIGNMSTKFKYATIGALFVNVSIGGTLSHFAAPPVLMVAGKWGWGLSHMFSNFGYKAAIACVITSFVISMLFKKELEGDFELRQERTDKMHPPMWITFIHVVFLALVVLTAHHMVVFFGLFLLFLGFTKVTEEFQDEVQVKSSLMVGFFLAGLIVLGTPQKWWLQPLISSLSNQVLYFGATALTGITDNAALTYLGSLVELSDEAKYFLVAGSVTGGGLTVIANAPNPAGFGILKESFGADGITPLGLLKGALFPTAVAILCFELLPSLG
jgi:Na+/H+ antiporter NhaD/arsenite permease-like protein